MRCRTVLAADGGSGFEGAACDSAGRLVLLQEEASRVLVLSPDLSAVERVIDIVVERRRSGFGAAWARHPNERGEGLLLLRDGHLVVAKQKGPAGLIEFGPAGEAPFGVSGGSLLPADQEFRPPGPRAPGRSVAYAVLDWWELDEAGEGPFESLNDLAAGDDGPVLAVSSSSRRIGRLERTVRPGAGRVRIAAARRLVEDDDDLRPEALALAEDGRLFVGVDTRAEEDNLWELDGGP